MMVKKIVARFLKANVILCFYFMIQGAREDPLNFATSPLYSSSAASPVWREGLKVGLFLITHALPGSYVINNQLQFFYKFCTRRTMAFSQTLKSGRPRGMFPARDSRLVLIDGQLSVNHTS